MKKLALALVALTLLTACNTTEPEMEFKNRGLETNTALSSIDLSEVLNGGPGKDGIPAINAPKFQNISETQLDEDVLGIFVNINNDQRFYPYTILVWHEIVNDSVGGQEIAVTFCPLCGTAIVYDRNLKKETLEFGVSGLLWQSNLLMYDSATESLWSQAIGKAVVGDYTGTELERINMQRITFKELKEKYPDAQVLSEETGYKRSYGFYPYGDYEENDELYFPVSLDDKTLHPKTIMLVVPLKDGTSVAFDWLKVEENAEILVNGKTMTLEKDGDEAIISYQGTHPATYFEMWFSWAQHHQEKGIVWTP